jgi:hypothetical protein
MGDSRGDMRTVTDLDHAKRLAAYAATGNDADAAAVLGLKPTTFKAWRIKAGLDAKADGKPCRPNSKRPKVRIRMADVKGIEADLQAKKLEGLRKFLPR